MTGNLKRIFLILVVAAAPVLFFQNCSKVGISSIDQLSEKAGSNSATGTEADSSADNQEDLADQRDDDTDVDGIAGDCSSDLEDSEFPESETDPDSDTSADDIADGSAADEDNCAAFRSNALNSFDFTFDDPIVKIHKVRGSILVLRAEILKAKNIRGAMYVLSPLSGKSALEPKDSPSKIKNMRGPLCVISTLAGGGKLKKLKNHRGYADLDNMNLNHIRNLRGKLVIRNSHVERIVNHRGPIILINSRVEKIRNQRGSITYVGTSTVGRLKNIRQD